MPERCSPRITVRAVARQLRVRRRGLSVLAGLHSEISARELRTQRTPGLISCSPLYTVGGTFTGVSVTPIILRWNFAGTRRITPWAQAAGGLLWTNHKFPAFGSPVLNLGNDGPNTDSSVWNFTPQGGIGLHYFLSATRSIDLGANAVHISSASLGDKNPGVNASVQFSIGYTWWKPSHSR